MQSLKTTHQKVDARREELGVLLPGKAQEGSQFGLEGSRYVKGRGQRSARRSWCLPDMAALLETTHGHSSPSERGSHCPLLPSRFARVPLWLSSDLNHMGKGVLGNGFPAEQ